MRPTESPSILVCAFQDGQVTGASSCNRWPNSKEHFLLQHTVLCSQKMLRSNASPAPSPAPSLQRQATRSEQASEFFATAMQQHAAQTEDRNGCC